MCIFRLSPVCPSETLIHARQRDVFCLSSMRSAESTAEVDGVVFVL